MPNESQWLEKLGSWTQTGWNFVKAIGPFLISQSEQVSKKYQSHRARLAEVDALKEFLSGEIELRKKMLGNLLQSYYAAAPRKRVGLERDIEHLEKKLRGARVSLTALGYAGSKPVAQQGEIKEIPAAWLDRFNELASLRNEPWRENLLARALASEATRPGTVSARALWVIGTMSEKEFAAFGDILDWMIATKDESAFLPLEGIDAALQFVGLDFGAYRIPNGPNSGKKFGSVAFDLSETGLVVFSDASKTWSAGEDLVLRSGQAEQKVKFARECHVNAIILTDIGSTLSNFHDYKPHKGSEAVFAAFAEWVKRFE